VLNKRNLVRVKDMNCKKCNNKKYIEVEVTYPVFFLPGVGYVKIEKKPCAECNHVGNNTSGSSDTDPSAPVRR